ncbi:18832_t:CDS:2 [Acaulospora morrowiae]|uniref:18832_t:CDS:1 n=1 Tax=Acaulospora morrowiae TaxID=94023 RepID=A0A9N8YVB6_9GLOM|nr:18832_t:CDS:2 [Acaulospora morrowiae]
MIVNLRKCLKGEPNKVKKLLCMRSLCFEKFGSDTRQNLGRRETQTRTPLKRASPE